MTSSLAGLVLRALAFVEAGLRTFGAFFTAYLVYGFVRPRISREMRKEIEEEDDDEDEPLKA